VPKLPRPRRPLVSIRPGDIRTLRRGTTLYRIYRTDGAYPSGWATFRDFGPTSARFDPHLPPPRVQDRCILYAAGSIPTALAEAFGATRVIELSRDGPYLAAFRLARPVGLLNLTSDWPTTAGASQAISSGRKDIARAWAQAIHEEYAADGLWYPTAMGGTARRAEDLRHHGHAVALFGIGRTALPAHPVLNIALDHPALGAAVARIADRFGYALLRS
jgi:hypothetical protein